MTRVLWMLALAGCPRSDVEEPACDALPGAPLAFSTLEGFSGAEDFAFDADGGLVSVDFDGNLISRQQDGTVRVIRPGLGVELAGTALLPDGSFAIAHVAQGAVLRVYPDGGTEVLLGGLLYPNGLTVGPDGTVYVADQTNGQVWAVDVPAEGGAGDASLIAEGLFEPNGVTLGPDGTLFVGSFGGGTVHAIRPEGGSFRAPELLGTTPGSGAEADPCRSLDDGTSCFTLDFQVGACDAGVCERVRDAAACAGKAAGDACETTTFGNTVTSRCEGEPLFCPYTPTSFIAACDGLDNEAFCDVDGFGSQCFLTGQGVNACYATDGLEYLRACEGKALGDACSVADPFYPYDGACVAGFDFDGDPDTVEPPECMPSGGFPGERGGLDGIAADACGNVYVTEFVVGKVWRFGPGGGEPEEVVSLPSTWIPNLHWGNGVGGWERDVLYVMDRDEGRVFGLEVGVEAAKEPYPLPF
jgi:sugar lactone lactonase YvrE